jgi:hypothetical protein
MPTPAQLALKAFEHLITAIVYGIIFCLVAYCFIG